MRGFWFNIVINSLLFVGGACRFELPGEVPLGEACGLAGRCMSPTPACDEEKVICVECTQDSECAVERPLCSTEQKCVQCESHADCTDSNLCLAGGTCAASEDVAYVGGTNPMPSANAICSKAMPCQTLSQALAVTQPRRIVLIAGLASDIETTVIDGREVDIYGAENATIQRSTSGKVIEIKRTSKVNMYGLKIVGVGPLGTGVEINDGPGPMVMMERVQVLDHRGTGIIMSLGNLIVQNSLVSNNEMDGIRVTGGSLQIKKSRIVGNEGVAGVVTLGASDVLIESSVIAHNQCTGGGASIKDTAVATIRNTIITGNGLAGNSVGGLDMGATSGLVEFSTISDNTAVGGLGIVCVGGARVSNSILVFNGILSSCPVTYSLSDSPVSGMGNEMGVPHFLDIADPMSSRYFRIGETSAARDKADPGASLAVDIDGQPRDDARKDMGAHEYRP